MTCPTCKSEMRAIQFVGAGVDNGWCENCGTVVGVALYVPAQAKRHVALRAAIAGLLAVIIDGERFSGIHYLGMVSSVQFNAAIDAAKSALAQEPRTP